jgi:PAS domain S-box-containing protein
MISREKELELVRDTLKASPRGLTVTDVAEKLHMSRNSSAKYLEMLLMAGQVDMRTFGRSKIFSLSHRMPLATALSLSSEMIVFIDESLQVVEANEQFLKFAEVPRGKVLGQSIESTSLPLLLHRDILLNIRETLRGREFVREISISKGRAEHYFKVKIIPVVAQDGRRMAAILFESITGRKQAELALKESEARYRAVVDDQTELVGRMLPDSTITFANDASSKLWGIGKDQLIGRKHFDFIPPEHLPTIKKKLGEIRNENDSGTFEANVARPGGQDRWLQWTYRGIFDEQRRLTEYQVVIRDITDYKRAELALKESEARYRMLIENAPLGIFTCDMQGNMISFNRKVLELMGSKSPEFTRSVNVLNFEPLVRSGLIDGRYDRLIRGECVVKEGSYTSYWGKTMFMRLHLQPLQDSAGGISGTLGIVEDITERKRAEEEVRATRNMLQLVMDNIPQGIFWKDRRSTYVGCNRVFAKAAGLAALEDIAGKTDHDLPWAPEQTAFFRDCDRRVMDNDVPEYHIVEQMQEADGKLAWVDTNKVPLRDAQGNVIGILGTYEDITERKRAEEELRMYKYIIENAPEAISLIGMDGSIIEVNGNCCNLLGYTHEELLLKTVFDVKPDLDKAAWPGWLKKIREEGSTRQVATCHTKDGEQLLVDFSASYFHFGGKESICIFGRKMRKENGRQQ